MNGSTSFLPDVQATYEYFVGDPRTYATGRAELDYFDADAKEAALVDSLGDRPVVVLTAGQLRKHSNPEELRARASVPEDFFGAACAVRRAIFSRPSGHTAQGRAYVLGLR